MSTFMDKIIQKIFSMVRPLSASGTKSEMGARLGAWRLGMVATLRVPASKRKPRPDWSDEDHLAVRQREAVHPPLVVLVGRGAEVEGRAGKRNSFQL